MEYPFRSIPRFVNVPLVHCTEDKARSNVELCQKPSENDTQALQNYLIAAQKVTDSAFNENLVSQRATSIEKKKQMNFTNPLPRSLSTLEHKYDVIKDLFDGPNTAGYHICRIKDLQTRNIFYAKLQLRKRIKFHDINFNKERQFLASIAVKQSKNSQISKLRDMGFDDDFKFLIFEELGYDLAWFFQNNHPFDVKTAFLVTYYSFLALKEFHSFDFLHLDLRPSSFSISSPFFLRLVDFARIVPSKPKPRLPSAYRFDRFSARICHEKDEDIDEFADYESWLYVMMFVTCHAQLPWSFEKEPMIKKKEKFFRNDRDYEWFGSADMLCVIPFLLRNEQSIESFIEKALELFSIDAMSHDDNDQPCWGTIQPEQLSTKKRGGKATRKSLMSKSDADAKSFNERSKEKKVRKKKSNNGGGGLGGAGGGGNRKISGGHIVKIIY